MDQPVRMVGGHRAYGGAALRTLAAVLLMVAGLSACQTRGEFRPFSSEVPPPPRMVDLQREPPTQAGPPQAPSQAQPQALPKAQSAGCTIEQARFALGQPMTQPLLEEMRSRTGAQSARSIAQGDTSLPPAPQRLLVEVDGQGRVAAARCA